MSRHPLPLLLLTRPLLLGPDSRLQDLSRRHHLLHHLSNPEHQLVHQSNIALRCSISKLKRMVICRSRLEPGSRLLKGVNLRMIGGLGDSMVNKEYSLDRIPNYSR